tara:strand:+ start:42 stop:2123 length:2082 start_codon:yes stop_codon:yes gene_type:complete
MVSDLTHTSSSGIYATNLAPYPIACIKSYFLHYSKHAKNFNFEIFKDPKLFVDSFLKHKPKVIGFSNYIWNSDLAHEFAKKIKKINPDTFIIFGGPNFPLGDESRKKWLESHPEVDVYVVGEGEESFTNIVDIWIDSKDIRTAKIANIPGCFSLVDENLQKPTELNPRIPDLDKIPSPYLEGYLDEFLSESKLSPILESNRGCPFSCTFCVDGIPERSRVYKKSVDRFAAEMEYIAQHYDGKILTLADLNFGMYSRDVEISKAIAKVKEKYNYPYYIQVSTGKNNKPKVLECADILKGSMSLAASVQSLDKDVLINVKRNNISEEKLLEMTQVGNDMSANTYSEVILALPGDSKEKHFETVLKLADSQMNLISMYQCMLLQGSELGSESSRVQWNMGSKFRILPRCFGRYTFDDEEIIAAEIEEICVSTSSLSLDDYYECRTFALTEGLHYQDKILFELYGFLKFFNILPSNLIPELHKKRLTFSQGITDLYQSFDHDTRHELYDDREKLSQLIKTDRNIIDKHISGELGVNVLFKHRAISTLNLIDDIYDAAFSVSFELLEKQDPESYIKYKPFLEELKIFCKLQKRNVFDYDQIFEHTFNYDFQKLIHDKFQTLPEKSNTPLHIKFYTKDEQKQLIQEQIDERGSDINGIGKILSRTLGSMLQRTIVVNNQEKEKILHKDIEMATSPGEFV